MNIIAITISVNYNDILKHVLNNNAQYFKMWYIVTSPQDIETISYIQEANLSNVRILLYDYFFEDAFFNKGGAVKFAQEHISITNDISNNILLIDSDIYLPNNFLETLPLYLEEDTLYSVSKRHDFWSLDDFINNKNVHTFNYCHFFVGFFQLFKQSSKYIYTKSTDATGCDSRFRDLFEKKISIDVSVSHLGRTIINWHGRDKNNIYEKF